VFLVISNILLAFIQSMKSETNKLLISIINTADTIREKVNFKYYRIAKGIKGILSYARKVYGCGLK